MLFTGKKIHTTYYEKMVDGCGSSKQKSDSSVKANYSSSNIAKNLNENANKIEVHSSNSIDTNLNENFVNMQRFKAIKDNIINTKKIKNINSQPISDCDNIKKKIEDSDNVELSLDPNARENLNKALKEVKEGDIDSVLNAQDALTKTHLELTFKNTETNECLSCHLKTPGKQFNELQKDVDGGLFLLEYDIKSNWTCVKLHNLKVVNEDNEVLKWNLEEIKTSDLSIKGRGVKAAGGSTVKDVIKHFKDHERCFDNFDNFDN